MEKTFFRLDDDWYLKAQSSLTNSELRILLFVAMNINGFNQAPVNISHSTIGKIIDMKRPHVSSALKSLIEKDWLKFSQKGYSLKSGFLSRKGTESVPITDSVLCLNGTESVHSGGTESVLGTESVHDRYEIRTCGGTESVPMLSYSKELKDINKKKENIKENKFSLLLTPNIDHSWRLEVERKFELIWWSWPDRAKGNKAGVISQFYKIAIYNLNEWKWIDKLECAIGEYLRQLEDKKFAIKLERWLIEWENWFKEHLSNNNGQMNAKGFWIEAQSQWENEKIIGVGNVI